MNTLEQVQQLSTLLDTREGHARKHEATYIGDIELSWIPANVRAKLGDRLQRLSINYCALVVDALAERLRITGFEVNGKPDLDLWNAMQAAGLDAVQVHTDALALGTSYVTVWTGPDGLPRPSAESAAQMVAALDPVTRQPTAALKRWVADNKGHAVLYTPSNIVVLQSNSFVPQDYTNPNVWSVGAIPSTGWRVTDSFVNPLGVVPVVMFANSPRNGSPWGRSEMDSISDLNLALIQLNTNMMVTSESAAFPKRWAVAVNLDNLMDENGNITDPWSQDTQTAISEDVETKFGQFATSDLAAYRTATELILKQIGALSGLPPAALGLGSNEAVSAEALRSSEQALVAKAEQRQIQFGKSWAQVARLMVAIRDNVPVSSVNVKPIWNDPSARSVAAEADAAVKLYQSGILSKQTVLQKLGYTPEQIANEIKNGAAEAVITSKP